MHKQALRTVCQLQLSLNIKTYFVLPESMNIWLNTENSLYQVTPTNPKWDFKWITSCDHKHNHKQVGEFQRKISNLFKKKNSSNCLQILIYDL